MKVWLAVIVACLSFAVIGCRGPKGDTGLQGPAGIDGPAGPVGPAGDGSVVESDNTQVYTGTIGNALAFVINIGEGVLQANATVTVFVADDDDNIWGEMGYLDDNPFAPWCLVNYNTSRVYIYNCTVGDFYKVVVIRPSVSVAPAASAKERFEFFRYR